MLWIRNVRYKPTLNAMSKLMGGYCEGNTTSINVWQSRNIFPQGH